MSENKARILFVDDEPELLQSLRLALRKHFRVDTATSGREGLAKITAAEDEPYAVVISDMRMPVMNGARFLSAVGEVSETSVRVLLTGETDIQSAILAVNNGSIFRFLQKPCDTVEMIRTLEAAVAQHRLVTAEKDLLQNTLRSAVRLLTDILGHIHPEAFSRSARIHKIVEHVVHRLKLEEAWAFELAGMLAHLGLVTIPPDTVERMFTGDVLADWEQELLDRHPDIGCEMLQSIPRLEAVAQMVGRQRRVATAEETRGLPARWEPAVLGGELIRMAAAYEAMAIQAGSAEEALERLRTASPSFPEALIKCLDGFEVDLDGMANALLMIEQLATGMVTQDDIRCNAGGMLASAGQIIDATFIARLRNFDRSAGVRQPIRVLSPIHLLTSKRTA
ncbi:MAG: response regulator [Planctomycetota bacterium]